MLFLILMIDAISNLIPLLETITEENACKKSFQFQQKFEYPFMTSTVLVVVVEGEE